ncbi:MAG TPA: hypothetical protein VFV46_07810 [Lacibacter sp.]|nr:hypothetical protein [Lacibacter sp.]
MIKYACLAFIISITCSKVNAQTTAKDSINYYNSEIRKLTKRYRDSLFNNPAFREYSDHARRLRAKTDDYAGFHLYLQTSSADFSGINNDHNGLGFSGFSGSHLAIGYGFTSKKNRRIFDWNLTAFGIGKKSTSNLGDLKTSFMTAFQFEWGYDFIKKNTINIYPYAGFGIRSEGLEYHNKASYNGTPTNLTNVIQNNTSVNDYKSSISYQAGIGMEFVITNPAKNGGVILCLKGGTNQPFSKKSFSFGSFNYDPQINYGAWYITTGFKFFGR